MQEFQISDRQYFGNSTVKQFTVPDGCWRIGAGAFAFSALERIEIAPTVREIGKHAFSGLLFLEEIIIPEGVTIIEDTAFSGCMQLRRVVLPKSLRQVGRLLFYGCARRVCVLLHRETCAHVPLDEWQSAVEVQIVEDTQPVTAETGEAEVENGEAKTCEAEPEAREAAQAAGVGTEEAPAEVAGTETGKNAREATPQEAIVDAILKNETRTLAESFHIDVGDHEWHSQSIECLGLNVRAFNGLKRAQIDTVEKLLTISVGELSRVRNLGRKSVEEIIEKLAERQNGAWPLVALSDTAEPKEKPGTLTQLSALRLIVDQPIEWLGLSVRPINVLHRIDVATINALAEMTREQILSLPNMGNKSVNEVLEKLAAYMAAAQARGATCSKETQAREEPVRPAFLDEFAEAVYGVCPQGIRSAVAQKTLSAWRMLGFPLDMDGAVFAEAAWRTDFFAGILVDCALKQLGAFEYDGIAEAELIAALPKGPSQEQLHATLDELEAAGKLQRRDERCFPARETLDAYLAHIPDERSRFCMSGKFQGRTLEDMAQELGITRERVRQIVMKGMRKYFSAQLRLYEDRYAALYTKYKMKPVEFRVIFREREQTWTYLRQRYCQGNQLLDNAEDDVSLPRGMRSRIRDYLESMESGYLNVNGRRIPLERAELVEYALREYCRDAIGVDAFVEQYNNFLRRHQIEEEGLSISSDTRHYIETRLPENRCVLWSRNRHMRYYDIDAGDYTELLQALDLGAYCDVEISTRKFMLDYPQVMRQYDIRDEYELHNLLKKIGAERENDTLSFGRMPMLSFGSFDRTEFMRKLLMEYAPCGRDTLIHAVSERIGVLPETVGAVWLQCIDDYYHMGEYVVDSPEMPEAETVRLQAALTQDAYLLDEIYRAYRRAGGTDERLLTPYNLKQLGFHVYSGFAVRNARSANEYFVRKLTETDVVDYSELMRRFGTIGAFTTVLNALKDSYEIIEFEPHQLIQLRKLQCFGIDRPQLRAFCNEIAECVQPGELFSMQTLRKRGLEFELDALGFGDTFYNSLLREDARFDFGRMGGIMLFRRRLTECEPRQVTRAEFACWLLGEQESMDIDDMLECARQDFGYEIDKYDLKAACEQSGFYWDTIMNRVYRNYDIYYDEV